MWVSFTMSVIPANRIAAWLIILDIFVCNEFLEIHLFFHGRNGIYVFKMPRPSLYRFVVAGSR